MSNDFNWNESSSVIVPAVAAIAVYTNPDGNIVIRQQDHMGDEDAFVVIPRTAVKTLIKALQAEAKG